MKAAEIAISDKPYKPTKGETMVVASKRYVFVPEDATVVRPSDLLRELQDSGRGLRYAALVYETSPSTLCRFLRKNGVKLKRQWAVVADGEATGQ